MPPVHDHGIAVDEEPILTGTAATEATTVGWVTADIWPLGQLSKLT